MASMMELDGAVVTAEDLRALSLINYGHFTSMRVEGTGVRGLGHHLTRLVEDCRTLFGTELDPLHVRRLTRRVAQAADTPAILRVTVFDPELDLAHPGAPAEPRVLVTVRSGTSGPFLLRRNDLEHCLRGGRAYRLATGRPSAGSHDAAA